MTGAIPVSLALLAVAPGMGALCRGAGELGRPPAPQEARVRAAQ